MKLEDIRSYIIGLTDKIRESPKRYSLYGHSEEFYQFIKDKIEKLGLELEVRPTGLVQNICTKNDDFDVLLMAHYDTPPRMSLSWISSYFVKKLGLGIAYWIVAGTCISIFLSVTSLLLQNIMANHIRFINEYPMFSVLLFWLIQFIFFFVLMPNTNNMNDNSSGVIAVLTIAKILHATDQNMTKHIKIVLTDCEELGKWGAKNLRKQLLKKGLENRLIINFDGVGNGDFLNLVPIGKDNLLRKHLLDKCSGKYRIITEKVKAGSDYDVFKDYNSIGINFLEPAKIKGKYYMPFIHTPRDTTINGDQLAEFTNDVAQFLIGYVKSIEKDLG